MAPPINPQTQKMLVDTVTMIKEISTRDKKIQERYAKMSGGLERAMNDQSVESIELYRPQLEKVVDEIDSCLEMIQGANTFLGELRKDEALMEKKFDQIEQLVTSVAAIRKKLAGQAAEARKLQDKSEKAGATIAKGAVSAEADLSSLKSQVQRLADVVKANDTQAPKLASAAKAAHAKGDQKGLTDARLKLIDFQKVKTLAVGLKPRIEKFKKQYPELTREQQAEVQWMLDDLTRAEDSGKKAESTVKELLELKPAAKDAKAAKPVATPKGELVKAAKAIGMADGDAPKLAKILDDSPRDKWPDQLTKLATQLKLKDTNGKGMAQKIDRIDYFRKQTLIDI